MVRGEESFLAIIKEERKKEQKKVRTERNAVTIGNL